MMQTSWIYPIAFGIASLIATPAAPQALDGWRYRWIATSEGGEGQAPSPPKSFVEIVSIAGDFARVENKTSTTYRVYDARRAGETVLTPDN